MTKQDTETDETRMPLTTADVLADRIERLRDLIPEALVERKINFDRLKTALGDSVDESPERNVLTCVGKADAVCRINRPSVKSPSPETIAGCVNTKLSSHDCFGIGG